MSTTVRYAGMVRPSPVDDPSDDLAGVEDSCGVQCSFDGAVQGKDVGADLGGEAGAFQESDAVFAADRAAEGDGGVDDVVEGCLGPAAGVVVVGRYDEEGGGGGGGGGGGVW